MATLNTAQFSPPVYLPNCVYDNTNNPFYTKQYNFVLKKPVTTRFTTNRHTQETIIIHPINVTSNQSYLILALWHFNSANKKSNCRYRIEFICDQDCYLIWVSNSVYLSYQSGGYLDKHNSKLEQYQASHGKLNLTKEIKYSTRDYECLLISKSLPERYEQCIPENEIIETMNYSINISQFCS